MLKSIANWFIVSSANPQKFSATIKGLLSFLVVLGIDQTIVNEGTDVLEQLAVSIGLLITAVYAAIGFVRKIYLTFWKK